MTYEEYYQSTVMHKLLTLQKLKKEYNMTHRQLCNLHLQHIKNRYTQQLERNELEKHEVQFLLDEYKIKHPISKDEQYDDDISYT